MQTDKIFLASDNFAPAHPVIMQALMDANEGYARSYGSDSWTERAQQLIQQEFNQCRVLILPTGTGGNVLALKIACKRHESVICTDIAHINYQESGAAEAVVGCKLLTVPHIDGKIRIRVVFNELSL